MFPQRRGRRRGGERSACGSADLQLGTNPGAPKDRTAAAPGDLRVSIGNFQGIPIAVLYRKLSADKKPMEFNSGVEKRYVMECVAVVPEAKIEVKINPDRKGYVVEAAIPFAELGFTPAAGLALRGHLGVTHSDPAGQRTHPRVCWSNQHTGFVNDGVFELEMELDYRGEIIHRIMPPQFGRTRRFVEQGGDNMNVGRAGRCLTTTSTSTLTPSLAARSGASPSKTSTKVARAIASAKSSRSDQTCSVSERERSERREVRNAQCVQRSLNAITRVPSEG